MIQPILNSKEKFRKMEQMPLKLMENPSEYSLKRILLVSNGEMSELISFVIQPELF